MSATPLRARPLFRRLALLAAILFVLWLLICAVGGWWLPGKLQREAAAWGQAQGRELVLGKVSINPFRWTVTLEDIQLRDADHSPLFIAQRLYANLEPTDLLIGRYRLSELVLTQPDLALVRTEGGTWNWLRFIEQLKGPAPAKPEPKGELPDLLIDHLAIEQGRALAQDGKLPAWRLKPFDLTLDGLATRPQPGGYKFSATLDDGARIDWQGTLTLAPLAAQGEVGIKQLTLARLWTLTGGRIQLAEPKGSLDLSARYNFSDQGQLQLKLAPFSLSLNKLAVQGPTASSRVELAQLRLSGGSFDLATHSVRIGAVELNGGKLSATKGEDGKLDWLAALPQAEAPAKPEDKPGQPLLPAPWRLAVDKVALRDWVVGLHDASVLRPSDMALRLPSAGFAVQQDKQGLALTGLQAELADLSIGDGKGGVPLQLAVARLAPGEIRLDAHEAKPGKLSLQGLKVIASRGKDGQIDLVDLFKPRQPKDESPSRWKLTPPELVLADSELQWHDQVAGKPVALALRDLSGEATLAMPASLQARLQGRLGGERGPQGRIEAQLAVETVQGKVDGTLQFDKVPLQPLAPYAVAGTPLSLASGDLSSKLKFHVADGGWQVGGGAQVGRLTVLEPKRPEPLVAWQALDVDGLQVQGGKALAINVDKVRLASPQLRLRLDEQRNLNLTQLFAPQGKQTGAAKTAAVRPASAEPAPALPSGNEDAAVQADVNTVPIAPASKPAPWKGPKLTIRSVVVKSAALDFADRSLNPGFASQIHDLNGTVQGIASDPGRHTTVTLDGQVDRYGSVRIRGTVVPFAVSDDSVLVMAFKNIPINSLDPYSSNFAGWHLEDGRLNVDLRYALKARQVRGDNKVVIQSIKLGEEVDRPGVTKLPLRLAVALLEDSDGRIELDLPVSGRLDDPEFSYGHLVGQAIATVLKKVVTAPFRALASLLGSEGFEAVTFAPGQAAVAPPEREKLAKLGEMLAKRPRLVVTLAGSYDPKNDLHAMARVQIDAEILTLAGLKPEPDMPIGRPDFEDPATRAAIRSAYGKRVGTLALAAQLIKTKDDVARYKGWRDEMIAALEKTIDTPTLQALARQRAELARAQIVAAAPALAERLKLAEPVTAEAKGEGVPMQIKLDAHGAPEPAAPVTPAAEPPAAAATAQ
ncbi:DUF748 domain-containing protein [Chitinimonas sp.]|uniref:DUF748 domain-containing protein n=1 Tax=Chitinimonas sp. TaxID=1934313 RepID=UPI002F9421B2